jgi:nitroimidazol reductase NimA-like FMN-containing flavoprotein (pyridoxamine 5'-phosphate oxidase superfamily)
MIEISSDECRRLLATRQPSVGRLAFVDAGWPMVFPMNYIADGKLIYLIYACTAPGRTLLAALNMRQVTFQIDDVSDHGWSVLAFGRLCMLTDEEELAQVRLSPLRPWAHDDPYYLRMDVADLTGRRFV